MANERVRLLVRGIVQGVGFRPFVYRLACKKELCGWVRNTTSGVEIDIQGEAEQIESFLSDLPRLKPPLACIEEVQRSALPLSERREFEILDSALQAEQEAVMLPDTATCGECLKELFDPGNRRYLYPFITCTVCGPRYSIAEGLPFDRVRTSMRLFKMCPQCLFEYRNPADRRFHSQTNSCHECGPHMELWAADGSLLAERGEAFKLAAGALREGKILALKGVGGFQLLLDARNGEAIETLRRRKNRKDKPFAVMLKDITAVRELCELEEQELKELVSAAAPIVLLRSKENSRLLSRGVAPGIGLSGIMLPYSPIHHILMRELDFPLIATSGNVSDEPICSDEREALQRLGAIADLFLVHNRPVVNGLDDSVVRVMAGSSTVFRRARGYAPLALPAGKNVTGSSILALGGHLKNTIALVKGRVVHLSRHLGTLESTKAYETFEEEALKLAAWYGVKPALVVCDKHPDYYSTRHAEALALGTKRVQHHYAHVLACLAENELRPPALGVAFDGSGYGLDGTVWGGEFLLLDEKAQIKRVGSLRPFRLPGGEQAVEEPRRAALGLLFARFGEKLFQGQVRGRVLDWLSQAFSSEERLIFLRMLKQGVNSPLCSSVGRLFDAVAALSGVRQRCNFEGQAAMELESLALARGELETHLEAYPSRIAHAAAVLYFEWDLLLDRLLEDAMDLRPAAVISLRFHCGLAQGILEMAQSIGQERVLLTGGVFQNKFLLERTINLLEKNGFKPAWHHLVPPNDGGVSFGQAVAAAWGVV